MDKGFLNKGSASKSDRKGVNTVGRRNVINTSLADQTKVDVDMDELAARMKRLKGDEIGYAGVVQSSQQVESNVGDKGTYGVKGSNSASICMDTNATPTDKGTQVLRDVEVHNSGNVAGCDANQEGLNSLDQQHTFLESQSVPKDTTKPNDEPLVNNNVELSIDDVNRKFDEAMLNLDKKLANMASSSGGTSASGDDLKSDNKDTNAYVASTSAPKPSNDANPNGNGLS